jgi:hypothetical protein
MKKENIIKEVKAGDKILRIFSDQNPTDPRSWDNLAKFICFHNRYNLGDKHEYNAKDYSGWAEMKEAIMKKEDVAIIRPLYLYDHSGITIKTTPFGDNWDSGQIGFVIVTREAIRENFGVKRVTKALIERAEKIVDGEVETYDQFLTGDVYGFEVVKVTKCNEEHEHEEDLDSCHGFFGTDFKTNGITDYIEDKELVDALLTA